MNFEQEYQKIKEVVDDELSTIENDISNLFSNQSPMDKMLLEYLTAPSKRLRPILGVLYLKSVFGSINHKQKDILLAVELIHNATLIHDDIIDDADIRRQNQTLNSKYDNNMAVIAGDFLLSIAMEKIISAGNVEVIKLCTNALKQACKGEISQYFSKFEIPTLDEYIEKSKNKTALLFAVGILGGILLSDKNVDKVLYQKAEQFVLNFGIAFQIRDDLMNLNKKVSDDIKAGIYTAPVIFAAKENSKILSSDNLLDEIKKTMAIEKTKDLVDNYFNGAKNAIKEVEEGIYKTSLNNLIELLKNGL